MNADYRMEEESLERMAHEFDIIKRIESGMSTVDDAEYVSVSFGLTKHKEGESNE